MLLAIHATAGALIGQRVNNPILAFFLSLISHFILDIVPHGDKDWIDEYKGADKSKAKTIIAIVFLDALILFVLIMSQFFYGPSEPSLSVASGILGGILPDCLVGLHEVSGKLFKRIYLFHFKMHDILNVRQPTTTQGVVFQAIILIILLLNF